jgi:hypothetical protein
LSPGVARRASLLGSALVLVSLAALFLFAGTRYEFPWVNHDVAHFLYSGRELLGGARLYVDWYAVNPPPLFLAALATNLLGSLTGLGEVAAYHLFVVALGLLGLAVLYRALPPGESPWVVAFVLLAYLVVVIRGSYSLNEFGQREHVFTMLFLPYVALRLLDDRRAGALAWLLLALLGFFSLMKPYFVAFVVATELLAGFPGGRSAGPLSRRLGPLAAGASLVLVGLALHSGESLAAFFEVTLPYHLRGGYRGYEGGFEKFLLRADHRWVIFGFALLPVAILLNWREAAAPRALLRAAATLPLLAYLAVLHQGKFWAYHLTPVLGTLLLFDSLLLGRAFARARGTLLRRSLIGGLLASLLIMVTKSFLGIERLVLRDQPTVAQDIAPLVHPGDRVMFFSSSMLFVFAPLHLDLDIAGPWSIHDAVPGLVAIADPRERERALASYAGEVRRWIDETRPRLFFFSPHRQGLKGRTMHELLVVRNHLVPLEAYRRLAPEELSRCCPGLRGWIVYERRDA